MKCPVCAKEGLEIIEEVREIPYFGKILLFTVKCSNCGFRKSDIEILEEKQEKKIEFKVEDVRDLNALVIRSSTASIYIPEFGAEMSPGPASQAFITTVEGVLYRFLDIVKMLKRWREEEGKIEEARKAEELIEKLNLAIDGKISFTIIIEDPRGNSAIVPKRK